MADTLDLIRAAILGDMPHGFFGRSGGASTGLVAGLNAGLGAGDDPVTVAHNRACAADAVLTGAALAGLYQVHSAECVTVREPWSDAARPHADAMVTDHPGVLLTILTADCAPVLLADREAGVIGAAHAGWKGALAGVIDATVTAMAALGARRGSISAAIGPCIAQPSYEVDGAFCDRFLAGSLGNTRFFMPGAAGHAQFALAAYVASRLAAAGIARIETLTFDTYADTLAGTSADRPRFYSFRRATHHGEPAYGRQISLIGLPQNAR